VEKSLSITSNIIRAIFGKDKAIIGVVHCPPLPGSPGSKDIDFKHGTHAITADAAGIDEIQAIRSGSSLPLLVGSGVTIDKVETILPLVDAVIVASALKRDGVWWNEVEKDRVSAFMRKAREIRVRIGACR